VADLSIEYMDFKTGTARNIPGCEGHGPGVVFYVFEFAGAVLWPPG
jgi:hypothetical protein